MGSRVGVLTSETWVTSARIWGLNRASGGYYCCFFTVPTFLVSIFITITSIITISSLVSSLLHILVRTIIYKKGSTKPLGVWTSSSRFGWGLGFRAD